MRRAAATLLAITVGFGLSGCAATELPRGSGVSACWGPDGDEASGGAGSMIFNDTPLDFTLTAADWRSEMNVGSVEYAMSTEGSEVEHEVEGYVIEAGEEAYLMVRMTPEDPGEEAALGGIHVTGEHGSETITVEAFDDVRYSLTSCD